MHPATPSRTNLSSKGALSALTRTVAAALLGVLVLLTWSTPRPSALASGIASSMEALTVSRAALQAGWSGAGRDADGPAASSNGDGRYGGIAADLSDGAEELELEEDEGVRRHAAIAPAVVGSRFASWVASRDAIATDAKPSTDHEGTSPAGRLDGGCLSSRGPPRA